jgi:magnesium-transporting ATPase (P-type)
MEKEMENKIEDEMKIKEEDVNRDAKEPFLLSKDGINYLMQKYLNRKTTEEIDYIEKLDGNTKFFETGLCTSFSQGLNESDDQQQKRIQSFDSNERPPDEPLNFCDFVITAMSDKIIIILCFAAVVELVVGMTTGDNPALDWVEGVCIVLAVFVVVSVGSINDYNKEKEFRRLKELTMSKRSVMVRREGQWKTIKEDGILTGDIMKLESGMTIPADCLLIEGTAEIDESAMTGEIDAIGKNTYEAGIMKRIDVREKIALKGRSALSHHEVESPIILSGTQVNSGDGCVLILSVGNNSENGKIRATINSNKSSDEGTPLEQKLSDLADLIGLAGLIAAIVVIIGMSMNLMINVLTGNMEFQSSDSKTIINIFIIGIIVIVVAIPEGLPLAVTMTLAFSIGAMLEDNNFVRRMESCETMGNAEYVCTDKTGTLTRNEMMVTKYFNFTKDIDLSETCSDNFKGNANDFFGSQEWELFKLSLACNTNTTFDEKGVEKGNKSDESLTKLLKKLGVDVKQTREDYIQKINGEKPQINFTSSRKKMSTIISHKDLPTGYRLLTKGASEIVMNSCSQYCSGDGTVKEFKDQSRAMVEGKIREYASETLRTFCISYRDLKEEELKEFEEEYVNEKNIKVRPIEQEGLTLCGLIGIKDHLKDGVTDAIIKCKQAGIIVIMITGDNIDTAFSIAKNCAIATEKEQTILGDKFYDHIGGIICKNCNSDYLEEINRLSKEDAHKLNAFIQNPSIEIKKQCDCPRSKDEWVLKWKSEKKQQDSKEIPDIKDKLKNEKFAEEYEKNLDNAAWSAFKDSGIKVKEDVVANIFNFKEIVYGLRVIARSQPQHKYALVTGLKQMEHVVSVTGDGTNDAPALSKADVGFAMYAGTDIAKEASDIVIMNNQFTSIVSAIKWGRNVFDNIRKFIQFQLTVNVSACSLVMIGASVGQKSPLTAIQMLWVNMIMDSLGSLALANEKPTEKLLNRNPIKRTDFIINRKMMKHIIGQSTYQLIVLFIILFSAQSWLPEYRENWQEIAYIMKKCYPEAPIYAKNGDFKPENMFVLSGMESFFSNSTNTTFPAFSSCSGNEYLGDSQSLKVAYKHIKSNEFATPHFTVLFNTFVLMNLCNEWCCRVIDDSFNFFFNIHTNVQFIFLWLLELALQIIIVCLTGPVFKVTKGGISAEHWGICIAFSLLTFPINALLKLLPDPCVKQEGEQQKRNINEPKGIIHLARSSSKIIKIRSSVM